MLQLLLRHLRPVRYVISNVFENSRYRSRDDLSNLKIDRRCGATAFSSMAVDIFGIQGPPTFELTSLWAY